MFNAPGVPKDLGPCCSVPKPGDVDPRTPDIIVIPNVGVVYTGSLKKQSEHGGFAHDDTNVMLLVSNPAIQRADRHQLCGNRSGGSHHPADCSVLIRTRSMPSEWKARPFCPACPNNNALE